MGHVEIRGLISIEISWTRIVKDRQGRKRSDRQRDPETKSFHEVRTLEADLPLSDR